MKNLLQTNIFRMTLMWHQDRLGYYVTYYWGTTPAWFLESSIYHALCTLPYCRCGETKSYFDLQDCPHLFFKKRGTVGVYCFHAPGRIVIREKIPFTQKDSLLIVDVIPWKMRVHYYEKRESARTLFYSTKISIFGCISLWVTTFIAPQSWWGLRAATTRWSDPTFVW